MKMYALNLKKNATNSLLLKEKIVHSGLPKRAGPG